MAEIIHQQIEATVQFEDPQNLNDVEQVYAQDCKNLCEMETGAKKYPDDRLGCTVESQTDETAQTLTLKCGNTVCRAANVGVEHPISRTLSRITRQPEWVVKKSVERDLERDVVGSEQ